MLRRTPFTAAVMGALIAAATGAPAFAYLASNGSAVEDRGNGTFHVPYSGLSGPADFWCAAGEYAIRHLHVPVTTRIYRASPVKRRGGEGVSFSLNAADSVGSSGLLGFGDDGSVSAAFAESLCQDLKLRR